MCDGDGSGVDLDKGDILERLVFELGEVGYHCVDYDMELGDCFVDLAEGSWAVVAIEGISAGIAWGTAQKGVCGVVVVSGTGGG